MTSDSEPGSDRRASRPRADRPVGQCAPGAAERVDAGVVGQFAQRETHLIRREAGGCYEFGHCPRPATQCGQDGVSGKRMSMMFTPS